MSGVGFLLSRLRIREVGSRLIKLNAVASRPAVTRSILQSNALKLAGIRSVTTKSTRSTSSGKTAAKKAPAKKAPAKKAAAKKKPAAKKTTAAKAKKPAAKKAVKKKAAPKKKTLTAEEKEKKKERLAEKRIKAKKTELKALALEPPSDKPVTFVTGYGMYLAEHIKGKGQGALKEFQTSNEWKNLPEAEKQKYINIAKERQANELKAYQAFVESYTPAEIREANAARKKLQKLYPARKFPQIVDHRKPKMPISAFVYYYKDVYGSPELAHHSAIGDRAKQIGKTWNTLSEAEKRPYIQLAETDKARYMQEKARLG